MIGLQFTFADSGEEFDFLTYFAKRNLFWQPSDRFQDSLLIAHGTNVTSENCLASAGLG